RHDRGFGLLEYLIALAVISPLAYAGTLTASSIVRGTQRSTDQMVALRQVQNMGYWMSRDLLTAQNMLPGDDSETPQLDLVAFVWTDWENAETHHVHYYYEDMGDNLNRVKRHVVVVNDAQVTISDRTTSVAENILDPVSLTQSGNLWKLVVQARSRNRMETREYNVLPRPNA
ncbi:MAG: hypothetical protein HYY32_05175, partial [Chloroflexi bacterium]|nr:hypothetical protein [Chloroflexota bacterium]